MNKYILVAILLIALSSCQNNTKKIDDVLNISEGNINDGQIIVEEQKLNISFENPKWIYIRLPNSNKVRNKILFNLVERNDKDFENKLCLNTPKFYYTPEGFWSFDETDLTKEKQRKILRLLVKYSRFSGQPNK